MDLTFAQDFTTTLQLDSGLTGVPDSGLYWNRGVHPSLNLKNLTELLPHETFTFSNYDDSATYSKFETSKNISDVVLYDGSIYLSLSDSNVGNLPDESTSDWLLTNEDSLRIRSFLWGVEDNVLSALNLQRKLIENQYIYNVGTSPVTASEDFIGWAFEPKGSDYVKIRINQISLQANTTDAVTMSVINQGQLIDTITLNPNNGILSFEDVGYTISGKGIFYFVIPTQEVLSDSAFNEPLKYSGFVAYPVIGTGSTAASSDYTMTYNGNGLGFNISAYLDGSTYVTNNLIDFAKLRQTQFEYDFLTMLYNNSHAVSNRNENLLRSVQGLDIQIFDLRGNTVARKLNEAKQEAIEAINKTFDKFLHKKKGLKIKRGVI